MDAESHDNVRVSQGGCCSDVLANGSDGGLSDVHPRASGQVRKFQIRYQRDDDARERCLCFGLAIVVGHVVRAMPGSWTPASEAVVFI